MKFRKKPVVIEAMQYSGKNGSIIQNWSAVAVIESPVLEPTEANPTGEYLQIKTLEGTMTAIVGDWIIRGVKGEFYPCKPDIFEATYEAVDNHRENLGQMIERINIEIYSTVHDKEEK